MACRSRSAAECRFTPVCVAMPDRALPMPQSECERLLVGVVTPDDTAELVERRVVGTALLERELKGRSGGLRGTSDDEGVGFAAVRRRGNGRFSRAERAIGEQAVRYLAFCRSCPGGLLRSNPGWMRVGGGAAGEVGLAREEQRNVRFFSSSVAAGAEADRRACRGDDPLNQRF
ncbi:hypothetical protein NA57DRAFT_57616 [Rhizodiscina lignyota]|uniref:Uncharacterized protein n=1 Tax=Rhizodiscina lignyota TaxID=1504668 RepID=A0A9P4IF05_9PEZI|nr:hypothetical protein NA57DRAFT_57616 [Rhizodiscina lignyota]